MTAIQTDIATPPRVRGLMRFWPLAALGAAVAIFFALGLNSYFSFDVLANHRDLLQEWIADNALLAVPVFIAIYATGVVVLPPSGTVMTLAGGFLFGTLAGGAYVVLGATVGATLLFLAARTALADLFHARAGRFARAMEEGFKNDAFNYLLVLRLVPLFPFWLVNVVPALLGVSTRHFVMATALGIIPGTFVYASVGNGLGAILGEGGAPELDIITEPQILLPMLGLAVLALVPVGYKRLRARRG